MSYEVFSIPPFDKQLKRLVKKYASLKQEFSELLESLEKDAQQGKGKSGGARVITNFIISENAVYLISIHDKSEKENLTDKELGELLKFVPE